MTDTNIHKIVKESNHKRSSDSPHKVYFCSHIKLSALKS